MEILESLITLLLPLSFGLDSFVCVCSAQYCDSAPSVANSGLDQDQDKMVYFVSDRTEHRMAKFELKGEWGISL